MRSDFSQTMLFQGKDGGLSPTPGAWFVLLGDLGRRTGGLALESVGLYILPFRVIGPKGEEGQCGAFTVLVCLAVSDHRIPFGEPHSGPACGTFEHPER